MRNKINRSGVVTIGTLLAIFAIAFVVLAVPSAFAESSGVRPESASKFEIAPVGTLGTESSRERDRPFRLGVLRFNQSLDASKPLAMGDAAGWAMTAGTLIGAFDQQWVGGFSLAQERVSWWFDGETDLTMPPAVHGSWAVLGFRSGRLVKLDAVSGKKVWETNLSAFSERRSVLAGNTLLVVTVSQALYAVDFQTGKTLWLYDGGFPAGLTLRNGAAPLVHDNKVLFGLTTGEILAVNFETGKLLWRYNPAYNDHRFHDVVGELVVRSNQVLMTRYDGLVASVDLTADKRVVWQEQLPAVATSTFRNGRYYVGCVNGDVYGFDAASGRRIWSAPIQTGAAIGSIMPGEELIYAIGSNGRIVAIEASSGKISFSDDVGGEVTSTPIVYANSFFVPTGLKNLYSYRLY
jgi:outer membrane protein assembly factor BamB